MKSSLQDESTDTDQSTKFDQHSNPHDWPLKAKAIEFQERDQASGYPARHLGITWQNLTVEVTSPDAAFHENVLSQFIPKLIRQSRHKAPQRKILDNSHGCVKPGEMLLVLGRPGSGCTTLLNILANQRNGYGKVSGDVYYGTMKAADAKPYAGQIVINKEEDIFHPSLSVKQTMDFATRLKKPFRPHDKTETQETQRIEMRDFLLKSMGIESTIDTKIGNAFIRGVSGGERKRVSIIECLATRASTFCWDNATRGLDANR